MADNVNPLAYIFPALAFVAVILYYAYGAIDRVGLSSEETHARVTSKNFAAGTTTYHTNVVAGRAWTQSDKRPDSYVVGLDINGRPTVGLVTKQTYDSLSIGDDVRVTYSRTRVSDRVLVTDVRR
jgi:hypothetical protein